MSYLVLARKYRPQAFSEVVRQEHVTQTLSNAISHARVAHAILFTGPRGTGKTTVARILAKAMNCKAGPTAIPCNACQSCVEITSGSAADVYEIDGASNNSVDQVRELRENIRYMPVHSPRKIYIIDEVHMLSIAAFNALLKTLEEPPPHVMFMFATTEPHKIPVTILSRCQRHDLRRIDVAAIIEHLERLCLSEGVDMDGESLALIAREAGGSMRDALSLLDQVLSGSSEAPGPERVLEMLGGIDRHTRFALSEGILNADLSALLEVVDQAYDRGVDMKKLYADLVAHFRNLVVAQLGSSAEPLLDVPAHEILRMREQTASIPAAHLNHLFAQVFSEEAAVRLAAQPRLAMETVLIRLCQIQPALAIDALIEKFDSLRSELAGATGSPDSGGPVNSAPPPVSPSPAPVATPDDGPGGAAPHFPAPPPAPVPSGAAGTAPPDPEVPPVHDGAAEMPPPVRAPRPATEPAAIWRDLFRQISGTDPAVAASLKGARVTRIDDRQMELEVAGNEFAMNRARRPKSLDVLRKACQAYFGKPMEVTVSGNVEATESPMVKRNRQNQKKQAALSHPLVEDALDVFDGKLVDVKIL
jgi:DNA polymerase III subunit gamma/tau